MHRLRSPAFAAWLLQRFGINGALVGDLLEQRHAGRSHIWYWRQVLAAIAITTINDIREHKLLALESALITWAVVIPWVESTWALHLWTSHKWVNAWVNSSVVLFEFWIPFGGGLCLMWCFGSAVSAGLAPATM